MNSWKWATEMEQFYLECRGGETLKEETFLVKILKHRLDALIVMILLIATMVIPFGGMKKSDSAEGGPRDARVICNFPPNYNVEKVDQTLAFITKKIMEKNDIEPPKNH